jgi:hypothetical protein
VNCCDYDCNQGRDCPARTCPHCFGIGYDASGYTCTCVPPATVAKVGRKYHDREPIGSLPWRAYLKDLARSMLIVLAVVFISATVVALIR